MLISFPMLSLAANKDMQALQRDVALLQQQVTQLQESMNRQLTGLQDLVQQQDRRLAAVQTLVQQAVDAADRANTAAAMIQSNFERNLRDEQAKVVAPVVGVGARIDQVSTNMQTLQQAVNDLTSSLARLQVRLTDIDNAVRVLQPPAPLSSPPSLPGTTGIGSGTGAGPASSPAGIPPMPATGLFDSAHQDYEVGHLDLALQEFSDYMKSYGDTALAPNAQYYIASIRDAERDYDGALKAYDVILQKYPNSDKLPDAMYGKGSVLAKTGRAKEAVGMFQELMKRFPGNDLAGNACEQLKGLGYKCDR